eukprot:COSAG02_NODE_646_length_18945_cov_17.654462_10_plen_512_part_00
MERPPSTTSSSDGSSSRVPTPPVPRRKVEGESEDYHASIQRFRAMCPTRTPQLVAQPLRQPARHQPAAPDGGSSLWDAEKKDWVSEAEKETLHHLMATALQEGVGELHSAIAPGQHPFGGFSPPISPPKVPALQMTLARHYPVSRLNPLPTAQQLVKRHKEGLLTQAELWRGIEELRHTWGEQKRVAEERVYEQRAFRDMLVANLAPGPSATARSTTSAPSRLQPVELESSTASTRVALPGGRPTKSPCNFVGDGRNVSGATTTDERADEILARLNALATPDAPLSPSSSRRSSPVGDQLASSELRHRPRPPSSRASVGSISSVRSSSRASIRSLSARGAVGGKKKTAADALDLKPAVYQEIKPESKEYGNVEAANDGLQRLMTWAKTTAHDRHQPPIEQRRNPWKPRVKTPEPAYLKLTSDSARPVRIGSPIFPNLQEETKQLNELWQSRRDAVKTPEEDPNEASKPLYYFHPVTGEVVMPDELPPDVLKELEADAAAAAADKSRQASPF